MPFHSFISYLGKIILKYSIVIGAILIVLYYRIEIFYIQYLLEIGIIFFVLGIFYILYKLIKKWKYPNS